MHTHNTALPKMSTFLLRTALDSLVVFNGLGTYKMCSAFSHLDSRTELPLIMRGMLSQKILSFLSNMGYRKPNCATVSQAQALGMAAPLARRASELGYGCPTLLPTSVVHCCLFKPVVSGRAHD